MSLPKDPMRYLFPMMHDLYEVAHEDVNKLDPNVLIERIKGIHKGLSAEHEFAAIASWLGSTRLIVSADDVLHSDGQYRVPDFLVVVQKGDRDVKFLVEVKSDADDKLKWSEKYLSAMKRFADLLGMPLLVAWKWHGMWALVDVERFEKKNTAYHLTFDAALKNNLMSALSGNVFLVIKEGFRLEFKLKLLDPVDAASELLSEGQHTMRVADVGLYTHKGKLPKDLTTELFPLIMARSVEPETEREGEFLRHIYPADHENMFNVSELLIANLCWSQDNDDVDWLAVLRNGLPVPIEDLRGVLMRAIEAGVVRYVFEQQPQIIPTWLEGIDLNVP